jgi:hypothetical protein
LKRIREEELGAFLAALTIPFRNTGYIGAGTGSLIIQAVIAFFVGGLFVLKIYWKRIVTFFSRNKEAEAVPADDEAGAE